nr:helix-turn-helix domain-containing protein [Hyperthermus butylicus]
MGEDGDPVGPTELSDSLEMAKSTAHKKLTDLAEKGLVQRLDSQGARGKYKPTPRGIIAC